MLVDSSLDGRSTGAVHFRLVFVLVLLYESSKTSVVRQSCSTVHMHKNILQPGREQKWTQQVEKTDDLMEQTKQKASAVTAQANAVSNGAKSVAHAAERQKEALVKARDMIAGTTAATEEALAAFRFASFCVRSTVVGKPVAPVVYCLTLKLLPRCE